MQKTAGTVVTTYTYDGDGHLLTVATPNTQVSRTYQGAFLSAETQSNAPAIPIRYSYFSNGKKNTMDWGSNVSVQYYYDKNWNLQQIRAHLFGQSFNWSRNVDALGRPITELQPNGIISNYAFDAASQLTDLKHILSNGSILSGFTSTFSITGERTSDTEVIGPQSSPSPGTRLANYTYDGLNRLTSSMTPDEVFTYDLEGNRTESAQQLDAVNRLLSDSEYSYTYDADGNLLSKTGKSRPGEVDYFWDTEDRLVSVSIKSDATHVSKQIVYNYDGLNRRIQKSVTDLLSPADSYTRKYIYDGQDIIAELDGNSAVVAVYLHGPWSDDPLVMLRDRNGDGRFDPATETFFYTKDAHGNVRDLTDGQGVLQQRYRYSAYGITEVERDQGGGDHVLIENPFAFTGREWEQETGDYYYRARYYDPHAGRFLSTDPIGFGGGDTNLYRYVFNNPTNAADPSGQIGEVIPFPIEGIEPIDLPPIEFDPVPITPNTNADGTPDGDCPPSGGHNNNKRPSSKEKHQNGDSRRKKDQGGEKGDQQRRPPRQRPPGTKGPWPRMT